MARTDVIPRIERPVDHQADHQTNIDDGSGDHDRFAHYVNKVELTRSAVTGEPVVALCGKKWVPTRDAKNFPICPTCKEIHGRLKSDD